ncbi:MAG TPA: hypothetical protein DCQ98_10980 [Planctomycetaceae bacterium]|nr:hypothetical protein [Planctomycetaceae bacterium]HRE99012.1 site-2 protease family protein [Pirellulaceae bacterium]
MFLNDSGETAWDLRFQVLGFPVRVQPMFWLTAVIFSGAARGGDLAFVLVGITVFFISILVHELGHALMMARFGQRAYIVLHGFGGYAAPDSGFGSWNGGSSRARSPREQILISAAGPAAGFALALVGLLLLYAAGGRVEVVLDLPLPHVVTDTSGTAFDSPIASPFIALLLHVNIVWGLLNLMPVFPLDGGQIARQLMVAADPWQGIMRSTLLSLVVSIAIAVLALLRRDLWLVFLFGSLAYSNWELYQQTGGRPPRW